MNVPTKDLTTADLRKKLLGLLKENCHGRAFDACQ